VTAIRIAVLSDLHLDIRRRQLLRSAASEAEALAAYDALTEGARQSADGADIVVLAGDIAAGIGGIEWAAATFDDRPVLYVAGNHEFYRYEHRDLLARLHEAAASTPHVRFLEQTEIELSLRGRALRFLGCTAWTDYRLYGEAMAGEAMRRAEALMYDHQRISFDGHRFRAEDAHGLHRQAIEWLGERMAGPRDTIVITHHAPSPASVEPRFQGDSLSPAFATDVTAMIERHAPPLWIHGHTHHNVDYHLGITRIVTHQWGYPGEDVARGCKLVEV
jgi:hypothetical protein